MFHHYFISQICPHFHHYFIADLSTFSSLFYRRFVHIFITILSQICPHFHHYFMADLSAFSSLFYGRFVHTINGTAIAMPRCIIALCETHQEKEGRKELRLPHHLEIGSSDVVTEGEVPLEKIMTYDEKCARRYIVDDSYKEMLKGR